MGSAQSVPELVRFGVFEADFRACELRRSGVRVRLQDLPFRALTLLLARPGELITHEEFRQALWSEDVFVDFERGLRSAIKRLRDALGDNSDNPIFIETVERRGYRWIAPVQRMATAGAPEGTAAARPAATAGEPAAERPASSAILYWAAFALVLIAGIAVVTFLRARQQPQISAIAVLPFDNLSAPAFDDSFSDGLTDEIAASMAHLEGVRVAGRHSAYTYKGKRTDLREIGQQLDVDAVVEGSVQRSANRTHVTVELTRTRDGFTMWSQTYEGTTADWFQIESQIANSIARNLARQVKPGLAARATPDPEAHALYLQARFLWNERNYPGLLKSVDLLQQAITRDPNYALAWAGLADSLIAIGNVEMQVDSAAYLPRARDAAQKALQLDPTLAEAHAALGNIACNYDYDWSTAEREYKKALELNPSYASAHQYYAVGLMAHGRFAEAEQQLNVAHHLDPLAPVVDVDLALLRKYQRRYDDVIAISRSIVERDPKSQYGHAMLTTGYFMEKRWADWLADDAVLPQNDVFTRAFVRGDRAGQLRELKHLEEQAASGQVRPFFVVHSCNQLRDRELTLLWLEKSYEHHDYWEIFINVDPEYDWLRAEPRFQSLVHKLGLAS